MAATTPIKGKVFTRYQVFMIAILLPVLHITTSQFSILHSNMGINSSVQQVSGGIASAIAGLIVVQNPTGE